MQKAMLKHITKEMGFALAALGFMLIIIVLTALANAGFNPEQIDKGKLITNLIMNSIITITATIVFIPVGVINTKQRVNPDGSNGRYLQDFYEYSEIRQKIEPRRIVFNQWHQQQYLKELYQKKVTYLLDLGIEQAEQIMLLDRSQIVSLDKPQCFTIEGEKYFFKSLTPIQIKGCLRAISGKINVHKLSDFYFLYPDGKGTKSFYDQAYYETKRERNAMTIKIIYHITLGILTTCVFTGLDANWKDFAENPNAAFNAFITMVSRIFNAISSAFWGSMMGQEHVYMLCYYLTGRTQFLKSFDADKDFIPVSVEDQAKQEYIERVKEETLRLGNSGDKK